MCVQSLGREDPLRKEWQITPVFLPRESHGQRSLEGYNPWGHKESDMTEQLIHSVLSCSPLWKGADCPPGSKCKLIF